MDNLVSVVIPVYNAAKTITKCLDSVMKQSYPNLDILVIDDGSEDTSLARCHELEKTDPRIHVFHEENKGVSAARNLGIEKCSGEYITFVDSDDELRTEYISNLVEPLLNHNDVVISGICFRYLDKDQEEKRILPPESGHLGNEIWDKIAVTPSIFGYIAGKMFRKDIISDTNLRFNEMQASQEDLSFCLSYYEHCESFFLSEHADYIYNYIPSARKIPYAILFGNKLKVWEISSKRHRLTQSAQQALQEDIAEQVFVFAYEKYTKENFFSLCEQLYSLPGLADFIIQIHLKGEVGMIAALFANKKYGRIQRYMKMRASMKKMIKK